jgi:hypothetical protein
MFNSMKFNKKLSFVLAGVCFSATTAFAAPVGMVCHIVGNPEASSRGARKPLRIMQRLSAGDKVIAGADEEAVVVLFGSGERFKVSGGEATVAAGSVSGARSLGKMGGPSARVAQTLGNARLAAVTARAPMPNAHQKLAASENDLPDAMGWMEEGNHLFQWPPVVDSDAFSFTLYGKDGEIVWNTRGAGNSVQYPATAPALKLRQAYMWEVVPLKGGEPKDKYLWGLVTFLSKADSAQLSREVKDLKAQAEATPDDATPLLMLAGLYREYGVLEMALQTLEDFSLSNQPGIEEALIDAYRSLSPRGRLLVMQSSDNPKIKMNIAVLKDVE